MNPLRILAAVALLAGATAPANAQAGRPYPVVLVLPASVRFAGLGGAGVAVIGDAGSVFVNPAGLAAVRRVSFEGATQSYVGSATQAMGAGAVRVGQFDFGAGVNYLHFDDSAATRSNLLYTGTAVYRYGFIALGGSAKYASVTDSAGRVASAVTGDIGTTLAIFDILALAVSVQNVGQKVAAGGGLDLPTTTHLGVTFNFVDPQGTLRLRGVLETVWSERRARRTVLGGEAGVVLSGIGIVARFGFGGQPEGSGETEQSYGGSLVFHRFTLDYAYQRRTVLGRDVQRFGARWTP